MTPAEAQVAAELAESVSVATLELGAAPWPRRQARALEVLKAIHLAWWKNHLAHPARYQQDLDDLNELAGWTDKARQVSTFGADGQTFFLPPKFFGGDPLALGEHFVLSISLNHAIPAHPGFAAELAAQGAPQSAFDGHLRYFKSNYAHAPFFSPRGTVLASYARTLGHAGVPTDWRGVNERYALYIEAFPTRSRRSVLPTNHEATFERIFLMALNTLARRAIIGILKPRVVLLAGQATWNLFDRLGSALGRDAAAEIRPVLKDSLQVYVDTVNVGTPGQPIRVVRTNFFPNRFGPNSTEEWNRLGTLLAVGQVRPAPLDAKFPTGLSRQRMLELLAEAHLVAEPQAAWTRVDGAVPGRFLSFRNGPMVSEIHLRSFRTQHAFWEEVSPATARERHWGMVRCRLVPVGRPSSQVDDAVRLALAALNDPTQGAESS